MLVVFLILTLVYYRTKFLLDRLQNSYRTLSQEKEVVLSFIREIGDAFTSADELKHLFQIIITCSKRTLNASAEAIFLLDESHSYLQAKVIDGLFPPIFEAIPADSLSKVATKTKYLQDLILGLKIPVGEGIVGRTAQTRTALLIKDATMDSRIAQPPIDFLKVKTLMVVPLIFKEEVIGVMIAANKKDDQTFTEIDLSLFEALSDQAALSIHNARLYQAISEKEKLDKELKTATQVQKLLLPARYPEIPGFDFSAVSRPARQIGGDYYDFFPVGTGQYGMAIADVSGKGIPAALIMTMARSILRSSAPEKLSPRQVLSELNRLLHGDIQQDMFISMAYLVLDEQKKQLKLTRAGHEPILFYDKKEGNVRFMRPQGIVLGMDPGSLFTSTLEEILLVLNPGDIVVLYTDGVTEAQDFEGQEFGYEALAESIRSSANLPAQEIANYVIARILRFTGNIPQRDDLTLLIIKAL